MTQPTLTRRGFLAAITAAVLAGPRALASLLEQHRHPALVFSIDYPYSFVVRKRTDMQAIWTKMQSEILEGFQYEPEEWINVRAASGFRAWSQRHPS